MSASSAGSQDITTRLRKWTHAVDAPPASDLMDDAAGEIERLRLTDEEREAIEWAINKTAQAYDDPEGGPIKREAMRGLLQRTK